MKRTILAITALATLLVGCGPGDTVGDGGPVTSTTQPPVATTTTTTPDDPGTTTTTAEPVTVFASIYLVKEGLYAEPVLRAVSDGPDLEADTLQALLEGPNATEEKADLSTAIPPTTILLGLQIDSTGLATVDLSREFESGGGSFSMISRLAQVVYTLTQFPTVEEVLFLLDGQPVTVFSNEGLLLEGPVKASDYYSALPLDPVTTVQRWEQNDLPDFRNSDVNDLRRVVLVTADDVLNVRTGAGVSNPILGGLAPLTTVILTGDETRVGSSTWVEIETPRGDGWVNSFFLGRWDFPSDVLPIDVRDLLDRMAEIILNDGDLSEVASQRGLYVAHHTDPIRFRPSELETILTDSTTYQWGSNAADPEEIPGRTFKEQIADSFVSVWLDDDRQVAVDEAISSGNGAGIDFRVAFELKGFHFISVHDPGDNPDFGGIDWRTWNVSIDYENGRPVVVGMTVDEWAP